MATTHRSDLIDELEKALRDEAYDGGMGSLSPEKFTDYVRGLAVTAAKVVEEADAETDERVRTAVIESVNEEFGGTYGGEEIAERAIAALRRSEVPEPSAEVIGEWFTSSHGVAVAAVAPMTDRGPAVMVDGRVICPNDVAALVEFKAHSEPSDALDLVIHAARVGTERDDPLILELAEARRATLRAAGGAR